MTFCVMIVTSKQGEVNRMKKDMDKIIFESRWEIGEVITALEEWQETHGAKDEKADTVKRLIDLLDVMSMEW